MRTSSSLSFLLLLSAVCVVLSVKILPTKTALIIIDYQNDFVNGSLIVPKGLELGVKLNSLRNKAKWNLIVVTKDWHPQDHISFASNHPGKRPFDVIQLPYGPQVLWPDHCVINSTGAEIHESMEINQNDVIVKKGSNPLVDSYSAFLDNDRKGKTELDSILKRNGITRIFVGGLAYDYCVRYSCLDGIKLGYQVSLVEDASASINKETENQARKEMIAAGVKMTTIRQINL